MTFGFCFDILHKLACGNTGKIRLYPSKEISKNCLTKGIPSVIIVKLAYGKPRTSGPANLENDTEKKRAIKEKDSEDSKS